MTGHDFGGSRIDLYFTGLRVVQCSRPLRTSACRKSVTASVCAWKPGTAMTFKPDRAAASQSRLDKAARLTA
jgi:hypothetical protein